MNPEVLRLDQIKSFANNEQVSLVYLLCSLLHMLNIIQLNLNYIITDQRTLLKIFRNVVCHI